MILVTSANGRTGRSVIRSLAAAGAAVRAFDVARDLNPLRALGAGEVFVGDLLDQGDLARAMDGVEAVVHIGPPMHPAESDMGRGVVIAARRAGIGHFVQFSVVHPQLEPLLNHQSKLEVERYVLMSRLAFTILQPMHYMQNIDPVQVAASGVLGQPYDLDTPLAYVDLEDVAEVAAKIVGNPIHHYATYELCGTDYLNGRQVAAVIAAESGCPVEPRLVGLSDSVRLRGGMPEDEYDYRHDALERLFRHYGRYGITGNPNVLTWLLGRAPTTFEQYVRRSLATSEPR